MLLHIILAHIYNNPNVAALSIAGLLLCWLGIGWCLRVLVVEWHSVNIVSVQRWIVTLAIGQVSVVFAREIKYTLGN